MKNRKKKRTFKDVLKSKQGAYIIISLLFFLILCVYPDNNLFTWISAKIEIHEQEKQMRKYENGISEMQERIKSLKENRDTLERFARENFHFTASDEDVYLLEE